MGLLEGKVAIVTGAGGGIGRAEALALAREGARVVVNDLGVARDGTGGGEPMAERVAAEIREMGGEAIANMDSVADVQGAEAIVKAALDAFGRVDVLVNNAGILRDRTLLKMTDEEFDAVIKVHLYGTFYCTRAAVRAMKERGEGGRIVNTTSYAGLVGNFGQTNYAAAKAGIAGLTRTVALEVRKLGILVNAIAPLAKTRMTADIAQVPEEITPEQIAPFTVFLASPLAEGITGRIFGVHGRHLFEYRMVMTDGVVLPEGETWTPERIAERIEDIARMPQAGGAAGEEGAGGSDAEQVARLFEALPATFKAGRAGSWSTVLRFAIGNAGAFTLEVKDGKASVRRGEGDAPPKATVTVDKAATLLAMARGELKPEQAFMAGKIKADDLGELMKFAKAFDLAAAAKALAGGAEASPATQVGALLMRLGEAFVPERAGDWRSVLRFVVEGAGTWTAFIEDGGVRVEEGAVGEPRCTIRFDSPGTLLGMARGEVKPEQAFMAGKVSADDMSELMKFARAFDLARAARALSSGSAPAPTAEASATEGLNPKALGKKYRGHARFVTAEQFEAYARAVGDLNPRYLEGSDRIAPPMFVVAPVHRVVEEVVMDPEVGADLLRLVHGEQDIRWHAPLRPWDLVYPVASFDAIEQKPTGELMRVRQKLWREGELVAEIVSGYFIRAKKRPKSTGDVPKKKAPRPPSEPPGEQVFEVSVVVGDDQPMRYAEASGDRNPLHTDVGVARQAGFPNVILHGLCTMAFACKAVVDEVCGGDPLRIRRLAGRFSRPVFPADRLTVRGWAAGTAEDGTARKLAIEIVNQDGKTVFAKGLAEVL